MILRVGVSSIDANRSCFSQPAERPRAADALPRIFLAGLFAFAFVALKESRHKEFLRQSREPSASRLAVTDDAICVVEIDDLDHGTRLRCIVANLVPFSSCNGFRTSQAHQRVAVSWRHINPAHFGRTTEQLLDAKARPLWRKLCASRKDARDARFLQAAAFLFERQ